LKRSLAQLPRPAIAPSLLASDFAHLADEIARAREAGADLLHVDVMDGHLVPNITIGPVVVEKVRACTDLFLDVHLMIEEPARYIKAFADAGADHMTFHSEVVVDGPALVGRIHDLGCTAGVTINPDGPWERFIATVPHVDMVLLMSIYAGFGGQKFMPEVLPRIRQIKAMLRPEQRLEIDGGINPETVALASEAGIDTFVAGTAVFRAPGGDYRCAIDDLRRRAAEAAR